MAELKEIVEAAARARRRAPAEPLLLATVVRGSGSSSLRPAARLLLGRDRWLAGSMTGACLDAEMIRRAWKATRVAGAALMTCEANDDGELGWTAEPGGKSPVEVLLQRCRPHERADPLMFFARCLEAERPAAQVLVVASSRADVAVGHRVWIEPDGTMVSAAPDGVVGSGSGSVATALLEDRARRALRDGTTQTYDGAGVSALVEAILPPPHLVLFGAGPDALPLVNLAASLGWKITVCDESVRGASSRRFVAADRVLLGPAAAVARALGTDGRAAYAVVMGDHVERDAVTLDALLESRARYIGVLGALGRTERARGRKLRDSRMHVPVGPDVPTETPAEVALAIAAEIQAVRSGAGERRHLERAGTIHNGAKAAIAP